MTHRTKITKAGKKEIARIIFKAQTNGAVSLR